MKAQAKPQANAQHRAMAHPSQVRKKKTGTAMAVHKPQAARTLEEVALEVARDQTADLTKMRELITLVHEQKVNSVIALAKPEMPVIVADSFNTHTKSKWARLEKVSAALDPIMRRHHLTITWGMADSPMPDHYRVIGDLVWTPQPGVSYVKKYFLDVPSDAAGPKGGGTKSPVQGIGSAISYARRYLKLMMFDITIAREDTDGQGEVETVGSDELVELNKLIKDTQANVEDFCNHFGIEAIPELRKRDYQRAMNLLRQKQAQQKKS